MPSYIPGQRKCIEIIIENHDITIITFMESRENCTIIIYRVGANKAISKLFDGFSENCCKLATLLVAVDYNTDHNSRISVFSDLRSN